MPTLPEHLPPNDRASENGWNEWGKHVLLELERLNENIEEMRRENSKTNVEIALLKFKCSVFGALAGMIPVVILLAIQWMGKAAGGP